MGNIFAKEAIQSLSRAIQNGPDVFVAGFPDVRKECGRPLLVKRHHCFAQPIERSTQWPAPFLVRSVPCPGIAATVFAPASYAVRTTPGTVLDDLRLVLRRMFLEVLAIIREPSNALLLDVLQCIRERHVAVGVMMSVAFAIRGDMHELRPIAGVGESSRQTMRKLLPTIQQLLEGDCLRNGSVVEEDGDAASIAQAHQIWARRIDFCSTRVPVCTHTNPAEARRLEWRQDRELDPKLSHHVERLQVDGGL